MNIAGIFNRSRIVQKNPIVTVVKPITEWTLPAGYTVDYTLDMITDDFDAVVSDYSSFWETQDVNVLMENRNLAVKGNTLAGMSDSGAQVFYVLAKDVDLVLAAFRIIIGDVQYNVSTVSPEPPGNPQFAIVGCTLWT